MDQRPQPTPTDPDRRPPTGDQVTRELADAGLTYACPGCGRTIHLPTDGVCTTCGRPRTAAEAA